MPSVKRLVFLSVPEGSTRLAMVRRGEVDVAYLLEGELGESIKNDPNLRLAFSGGIGTHHLDFLDMWDPKSPWADQRVRVAANHAFDRRAINEAETLGFSRVTGSIIPASFEFYWPPPVYPYDPDRARRLLTEAGYPNGFDAGEYYCDAGFATLGESVVNYFRAVGIRATLA